MPVKLIKFAKDPLIKPLMHLIKASFISGIFPDELKISKVRPIFKKEEENYVQNNSIDLFQICHQCLKFSKK